MYTMIKVLGTRRLLTRQVIIVAVAMVVAEIFYKFHSFTLECFAFVIASLRLRGEYPLHGVPELTAP